MMNHHKMNWYTFEIGSFLKCHSFKILKIFTHIAEEILTPSRRMLGISYISSKENVSNVLGLQIKVANITVITIVQEL